MSSRIEQLEVENRVLNSLIQRLELGDDTAMIEYLKSRRDIIQDEHMMSRRNVANRAHNSVNALIEAHMYNELLTLMEVTLSHVIRSLRSRPRMDSSTGLYSTIFKHIEGSLLEIKQMLITESMYNHADTLAHMETLDKSAHEEAVKDDDKPS